VQWRRRGVKCQAQALFGRMENACHLIGEMGKAEKVSLGRGLKKEIMQAEGGRGKFSGG